MSKIKELTLFFLALLIVSCQEVTSKDESTELKQAKVEIVEPSLRIEFNFKTNKSDVFKIIMKNIEVDELQKKDIHIFEEITPSSHDDSIVAEFGSGNISENILISLGGQQPKIVEIINISVTYGDKYYDINTAEDLNKYFIFNKFIEKGLEEKTFRTKVVDGVSNPLIFFKKTFISTLKRK
ncbi:hypothetical protein [uncultured Psychroserpens sp.]|uniref:hypothetical protein n=1 Tax=uncultured Psychroserpens sp. TaxID=255436 RepID=UPI0026171AB5|nr:hypothetical protein [uncultured Psychroserpens sp.]